MFVTIVHISVRPQHLEAFIAATQQNHQASITEADNRRFDVLQRFDDASQYEAYANEEAAITHKQTVHYRLWHGTVADWMETPRKGIQYTGLFPN